MGSRLRHMQAFDWIGCLCPTPRPMVVALSCVHTGRRYSRVGHGQWLPLSRVGSAVMGAPQSLRVDHPSWQPVKWRDQHATQ